jgi:hypothetical protein
VKGELNFDPDQDHAETPIRECDCGLSQVQAESADLEDCRGVIAAFGILKSALSDIPGEIVHSLQSFCISE